MALRQIRIGSLPGFQYDDGDYSEAVETDQPIKAGAPVDSTDVLRLADLSTTILSTAFPIGCVYITVISTNPGTLLGMGTWVRIAEGRMLVGFLTADPDFGTVEGTGGNKTIAHDNNHSGTAVAAHADLAHTNNHSGTAVTAHTKVAGVQGALPGDVVTTETHAVTQPDAHANHSIDAHAITQPTGHSDHNVLNPFFVVYVWKRTA